MRPVMMRAVVGAGRLMAAVAACGARLARRLAHQLLRLVRVVASWLTCAAVCWVALRLVGLPVTAATAVVLGVELVVAALGWWVSVVEPRLFAQRPSSRPQVTVPASSRPAPTGEVDHVVFARALSLVADRYRAECERSARLDRGGRP